MSAVTESPILLNLAMMQATKPIDLDVASQTSTETEPDLRDVIHKVEAQIEEAISPAAKPEAVVLVDPWSTGNNVWRHLLSEGFRVIVLWENNLVRSSSLQAEAVLMHYNLQDTIAKINSLDVNVKAVLPGSETGVPLSEALGNAMNLPTHPASTAQARRNKYIMGETLRSKGVRAVKQIMTIDFEEAKAFVLKELVPLATAGLRVIVKPVMGAGSDDVYLCKSMEDFEKKFKLVNGKINSLGLKNDAVLVQEFLEGIEYVLDSVSRHGIHRIVSIWQYDKREANDRFNIYHGSFPLVNDTETTRALVAYMLQVLEALEFKNGPSHAEIKITPTGPCLVEIGARCHGGGGAWMELANKVWGTNQIEVLSKGVRSTEEDDHFSVEFPTKMLHNGCVADMILYEDGVIQGFPGVELVKNLPSMHEIVHYNKIGDRVIKTVDCNTQPGHFVLMHEDKEQVQRDFDFIHQLMRERKYFDIKP